MKVITKEQLDELIELGMVVRTDYFGEKDDNGDCYCYIHRHSSWGSWMCKCWFIPEWLFEENFDAVKKGVFRDKK